MSPKNKGKFGKGQPAVEEDDEFLSTMSRVGKALEPHAKKLIAAVAVVTVLISAFFVYRWWNERKERKAQPAQEATTGVADAAGVASKASSGDMEVQKLRAQLRALQADLAAESNARITLQADLAAESKARIELEAELNAKILNQAATILTQAEELERLRATAQLVFSFMIFYIFPLPVSAQH